MARVNQPGGEHAGTMLGTISRRKTGHASEDGACGLSIVPHAIRILNCLDDNIISGIKTQSYVFYFNFLLQGHPTRDPGLRFWLVRAFPGDQDRGQGHDWAGEQPCKRYPGENGRRIRW